MDEKQHGSQIQEPEESRDNQSTSDDTNWDIISFSEEDAEHAEDDIASALAALGQYGMDEEETNPPRSPKKRKILPEETVIANDSNEPQNSFDESVEAKKFEQKLKLVEEKYQTQLHQLTASLRSLHSKLDIAESALVDQKKKSDEIQDQLVRVSADYQNYQKRSKSKLSDFIEIEQMKIFRSLLPILDNFKRAFDHADSGQGLREGLELIYKQFCDFLTSNCITEIPAQGESFDPTIHDAIDRRSNLEFPDNTILDVFAMGYRFHSKVLKPAQVIVNYLPCIRAEKNKKLVQDDDQNSIPDELTEEKSRQLSTDPVSNEGDETTSC